ncbi:nuclear transport factor 2 family protein [Phaeobacter sp. C3_T13_0]|uniref:nuclear transport factor 2 family protein n=1 Tax=Phaeobacter cretensis TaxID=3342641 RepID=UPI0039BCEEF2
MSDISTAKALIARFIDKLDQAATDSETRAVFEAACAENLKYRGVHPFNELQGPQAVADQVWSPLKAAMPMLQRRPDIFLGGHNNLPGQSGLWVVQMGNFLGDFNESWLAIPPTQKTTYVPYVSFYRIEGNKIAEVVEFLDIFAVISQAGLNPWLAEHSGGFIMSPGPITHDGVMQSPQDAGETKKTFDLTYDMLADLAKSYTSPTDHMAQFWHPDMNWFGPTGIGASLGFPGYRRGHTGPFEHKLDTVDILTEEITAAEGNFSGVMWWPCLRMRNTGNYMGVPANDALAEMRVVDMYRRDGDKLAENWIFIDMLHYLLGQGIDVLVSIQKGT